MPIKKWINLSSLTFAFALLFLACHTPKKEKSPSLSLGVWRMQMDLGEVKLPFNFTLDKNGEAWEMVIINAEDRIKINSIEQQKDSLFIDMPIYESVFELKIVDSTKISGLWRNLYKSNDYIIPVKAEFGKAFRFTDRKEDYMKAIGGKYEATLKPNTENARKAIALFNQEGSKLSGTFVTETGDYRHLDGNFVNDSLFLSTFDGFSAYVFIGENQDSVIKGKYYSGNHFNADWLAVKNETFELADPDSLTFIKEGYDGLAFSFPNANGEMVSLADDRFKNKVVIVQIMGSWCPNCLDETRYLTDLHNKYQKNGLEVIALAFERTKSKEKAFSNVNELKARTGANYPFLLATWDRKAKAAEKLPMLNHIMSFPTAIYLNRKGEVVKIHTGFYGPGTGEMYEKFSRVNEAFVSALLEE
jgi:thiol-disulfide isomerase/thioredoxin